MRRFHPWLSFTEGYTENEGKESKTGAAGFSSADGSLHMLLSVLLRRLRQPGRAGRGLQSAGSGGCHGGGLLVEVERAVAVQAWDKPGQ